MHAHHKAAACFIIWSSSGHPILAIVKNLGSVEILVAEAVPLRDGLFAIPNPANHQQIIVEGDSKTLLDAVNGYIEIPWRIKSLVRP